MVLWNIFSVYISRNSISSLLDIRKKLDIIQNICSIKILYLNFI